MNYLSHFYLSAEADDDVHLGNFLGDIVSKSESDLLPEPVKKGVELHRFIDHFTDNHPLVLVGKRLLYPDFGKYASVVLDVYFDFLLIERWDDFSAQALEPFLQECYQFIRAHQPTIPITVWPQVHAMIDGQWMNGYLTTAGRLNLFARLARRAKYDKNFDIALDIYETHRDALRDLHHQFFPELMDACGKRTFS